MIIVIIKVYSFSISIMFISANSQCAFLRLPRHLLLWCCPTWPEPLRESLLFTPWNSFDLDVCGSSIPPKKMENYIAFDSSASKKMEHPFHSDADLFLVFLPKKPIEDAHSISALWSSDHLITLKFLALDFAGSVSQLPKTSGDSGGVPESLWHLHFSSSSNDGIFHEIDYPAMGVPWF